ncbi:hypothetical protein K491DRAFT_683901 [Lophiostoma macrostomum CBS 122681]|uniref:Uncharacterized protein n=1 Tax=Lophiostoma macrostomum CBS 122681 TaxID=1314788 RepID=A0A6A6SNB2_9PLEO|nr:hypothetical protein K491DRAFT_683901 [Lophiostoma macrostomum CBS 122681]
MVYNWDGKEAECYRLYVDEKKSLDEVIDYWEQRGFTPSKRAFQTQFKRWDFPSKQNPAYKNPALIARVKELWESNQMQKDMLESLLREGFQINDRELLRLRLKFKWLLRESRATGPRPENSVEDAIDDEEPAQPEPDVEPLDEEEELRRRIRQEQLQIESAEKWRTRKRRRRTRGWAGLPADDPNEPPRFPSETTLDESKAYLNLDNGLYKQVRDQFQEICEEEGVLKKTIAGPEKWTAIKHRLVQENAHLSNIFNNDPEATEQIGTQPTPTNFKALSIDVICTDVTKRMRTLGTRMGIPEAKNALGLNPAETRQVRAAFIAILKADHFTNKYEAGDQHWTELKQTWIQGSDALTRVLAPGDADPKHAEKAKAIEVLARDVMKRLRAENCKKGSAQKKQVNSGPGPGPAPPSVVPHASKVLRKDRRQSGESMSDPTHGTLDLPPLSSTDLQIDPSLLLAASDPSMIPEASHDSLARHSQAQRNPYAMPQPFLSSLPLPIYFRLHPHSSTSMPNKTVWLGILQSGTVNEIRSLAMREHPGTLVVKMEGLVLHKMPGQPEREIMIAIDDEAELAAYLEHVAGGKATFVVLLAPAQGGGAYM